MSGPIAEATYILQIAVVENYLCIAAAALLIYEEVITLGDEVAHIRSPRKLGWLFLLNRLNTFALTASLILAGQTSYDSSSCRAMVFFRFTVNLVSFLLWAALSSLRVYAVSHRNNLLTVVTVLLGLAPAGVTLYGVTQESAVVEPVLNFGLCFTNLNMSSTTANRWTIASRSCTIASDALAVLVLWYFTPPELKQVRIDSAQAEAPLFSYLWAHGAINFIILLFMNLADMILDLTQTVNGGSLSYIGAYNPFPLLIPSITSVIITRFTLDLRKRALGVESSEHSGPMTTLRFSRASESSAVRSPPAGSNSECLTADIRTPPSGGGGGFTPTASHSNDIERADCTGDVDTPPPSSHEVVDARLATMDA